MKLNTEFDSRVLRVSTGFGGITRPRFVTRMDEDLATRGVFAGGPPLGQLEHVSCVGCGKPAGAVSAGLPVAQRGDPGVLYLCTPCKDRYGSLPLHAISYENRKED